MLLLRSKGFVATKTTLPGKHVAPPEQRLRSNEDDSSPEKHRDCTEKNTLVMKTLLLIIGFWICCTTTLAQDITTLEKIGPVVRFEKTEKTVTLHCQDNSQVQLTVLAPDLIRVRAVFTK